MADYRQSCSNPGCKYTGFSGHSPGCPVPFKEQLAARRRIEEKNEEDAYWHDFFSNMTNEELFEYAEQADKKILALKKYEKRKARVLAYMRDKYKISDYLDWKRN
jgi:hypothetical protein